MIWIATVVALVWGVPLIYDVYSTKKPPRSIPTERVKTE